MRSLFALLAALACTGACADTTLRYTVLFQGRPGGSEVGTIHADGRVDVEMSFRTNGRGPDIKEHSRFAADGTLVSFEVKGKSTFGAPIDESYTLKGGLARWRSQADHGESHLTAPAVYVPVDNSFETVATLAQAALRRPEQRIAALPGGELTVKRILDTQLEAGGRRQTAVLYALLGIDTQPDFVWLTAEPNPRLFAVVAPGFLRVIEQGFEAQGDALERLQVQAEDDWLHGLATRLAHRVPDPLLIRNVRVFDSQNARMLPAQDVYVYRGRIAAMVPAGSVAREARASLEGGGRVLVPALFDMHAHEDHWNLLLQIAGGVTTSRDMGNNNARLQSVMAQLDAGQILGPRIIPCGFIEGDSPFAADNGFRVKDLPGALAAVDWYAQHGYRQIKIYNSFHPEWVQETAARAHQYGMRVSGHVPAFMRSDEAIRAGYDEIQHINQLMLAFFVGPKDDTRTLARFYLLAEHADGLDLSSQRVLDLVELMKQHHTALDPTLTAFEGNFTQKQGELDPAYAAVADHLPVSVQRSLHENSMNVTAQNAAHYRASFEKMVSFVGQLYRAGVPLEAGTDNIAGFTLHRELENYVRAGLSPAQALQVATWNGARFTGRLADLGSIEAGKRADLILVDGDPAQNISDIRKISLVMKDGVVYYPAEVYESVGVKRFAEPTAIELAQAGTAP